MTVESLEGDNGFLESRCRASSSLRLSRSLSRSLDVGIGFPPFAIRAICEYTPVCFSNSIPVSIVLQWQYGQASMCRSGTPWSASGLSRRLTMRGETHTGQLKQLRVHRLPSLLTTELGTSNRQLGQYQFSVSSITHRGHRICRQSSQ